MQRVQKKRKFFIEEEGFVSAPSGPGEISPFTLREDFDAEFSPAEGAEESPFRFGRMFPRMKGPRPRSVDDSVYKELGKAMEETPSPGDHPLLPAGYTYLAQFVAHDMSFLKERDLPSGPIDPSRLEQLRSPSLDLDSLYGGGPGSIRALYKDDLLRMKIGLTEKGGLGGVDREYENDLPRDGGDPSNPRKANIADPRNDDNLIVAQTHVAFLKFHNAVADHLENENGAGLVSFQEVREKVVKHYQWIVLYDLLPRIIDKAMLNDLIADPPGRRFKLKPGTKPSMPVEFSFAAFRLGHCMARDQYEWNRVFQSPERGQRGPAKLHHLFEMTGFRGRMRGLSDRLPSNWVVDWARFYDFSDFGSVGRSRFNLAKRIGTHLSPALGVLPSFAASLRGEEFISLAATDLIRGEELQLPAGQDVAAELGETPLSPDQMLESPHADILKRHGFDMRTPLWYYILKEAELMAGGLRLGPVGSRIVAETFVGLIETSPISILKDPGWRPDLGQIRPDRFRMTDLLVFVDRHLNRPSEINPIG